MPAARPPHKPGRKLAPAWARLEMLRRAIGEEPRLEVSDLELSRAGPSYTIDTVRCLREALGEPAQSVLYLVLGSDNLEQLASWREIERILTLAQPIVVLRGAHRGGLPSSLREALPAALVERLEQGMLELAPVAGASSELRQRLCSGEADLPELPQAVADFIAEHRLYQGTQ